MDKGGMEMNLDCIDRSELVALIARGHNDTLVISYAQTKVDAIDARLSGDVRTALRLEQRCDRIYESLSKSLKW